MNWDDHKNFYPGPQKVKRPTGKRRKKRRSVLSVLLTIALALTALLLATATTGYFLITHRPADYQPRQWSSDPKDRKEEQKDAENRGLKKSEEFYNNTHRLNPFTIRLEQSMINDILLLDDLREIFVNKSPDLANKIRQIQISFNNNQIHLMGETHLEGVTSIIKVSYVIQLLKNNEKVEVSLESIKAGLLPIPQRSIEEQLRRLGKKIIEKFDQKKTQKSKKNNNNKLVDWGFEMPEYFIRLFAKALIDRQATQPAVFQAVEDKFARFTNLEIGDGYIDMSLVPFWEDE